jgi:hypothetical protein
LLVTIEVPPTARALKAATQGLVALNREILRANQMPPIYKSGVQYRAESLGAERWRRADEVWRLGVGDCEDLAAWRVAELQLRGELAQPDIVRTGFKRYHARVRRGDGTIEDPSALLGMRTRP